MGQDLSVKVMRLPLWKLVREKSNFQRQKFTNDSVLSLGGKEGKQMCGEVSIGLTENR